MTSTLDHYDWQTVHAELDAKGYAQLPAFLTTQQCRETADLYDIESLFRSHIHMARHNFGRGEYKYLKYPLPPLVEELRHQFYAQLAPIANVWCQRLNVGQRYPATLPEFIERCHVAGQKRPTPLLLKYGKGDYNCLHQDLYGDHFFPLQVIVMLSEPERDFTGGDLILLENRPRMQSLGHVVRPQIGDALVIAVNQRPQRGTRGDYRVALRHGVSEINSGVRQTLGIIMHDAA
ncbi:MAG: 2OG-Fe(II) oxygenase [Usitatibacteraceae bacterium]